MTETHGPAGGAVDTVSSLRLSYCFLAVDSLFGLAPPQMRTSVRSVLVLCAAHFRALPACQRVSRDDLGQASIRRRRQTQGQLSCAGFRRVMAACGCAARRLGRSGIGDMDPIIRSLHAPPSKKPDHVAHQPQGPGAPGPCGLGEFRFSGLISTPDKLDMAQKRKNCRSSKQAPRPRAIQQP